MTEGTAQRLDDKLAFWLAELRGPYPANQQRAEAALIGLVRGQADALQAATDERDAAIRKAEDFEGRYETAHANYMHCLDSYNSAARDRDRFARTIEYRVKELDAERAALQRVRELRDELARPPRDPVHRGIPLPTVGRQFVLHRLDAALGVGVPTEPEPTERCGFRDPLYGGVCVRLAGHPPLAGSQGHEFQAGPVTSVDPPKETQQ